MFDTKRVYGACFVKKITTSTTADHSVAFVAAPVDLNRLLELLHQHQFETFGPVCRNNAIVYAPVNDLADFPRGWTDEQSGGRYRLESSSRAALFDCTVGPQTLKKYFYPASQTMVTVGKEHGQMVPQPPSETAPRRAFIGVRACELAALAVLDRVLLEGPYVDAGYAARRSSSCIVAINCTRPGGTCFCGSLGTGPRATGGCDLALTEVHTDDDHFLVVRPHSEFGQAAVRQLGLTSAAAEQVALETQLLEKAAATMGRVLDATDLPRILDESFDDRHWEDIAERCLTCGNCTMVCPTCFCTDLVDTTDLSGDRAERTRRWDSCHTVGFSYIHGGSIRTSSAARYRQWLMHKLSYWPEQFGMLGCVGCGRCITWCPVGIDLTEEARTFRKHITG